MSDTETRSGRPSEHSSNPACDQCRARKVRCDRRQPECSNCRKAGVCCDFTNQSKRVNHIKQLLNDFSSVTSRLESIEAALGNLSHQLVTIKQPSTSSGSSRSGSRSSSVSRGETVRDFLEECLLQEVEAVGDDPAEFVHQGDSCCGCEQFFGVTSAHSLFKSAREPIEQLLRALNQEGDSSPLCTFVKDRPTMAYDLQRTYEAFPAVEECHRPISTVSGLNVMNGRPTTLPPKTFLLSALDIYLSEINIYNPIFKESSLREAVELRYSTPALSPDPDREAWSLCFNNIILLAMCHTARSMDNGSGDSQGIEHDLLQSFLRNTCRAIHNLERLSSPRFVNIQALATLALVGKECFEGCFFSQMLPRVFQIVRSTGLHRAQAHKSTAGASPEERRMLYWTLYRLDKQRCFLKGQPCDLYSFDTDIPMVTHETDTPDSRFITAMNSLMAIWEKIYLLLYSPQVKMRRRRYVDEQVAELELALKGWYRRHSDLLASRAEADGSPSGAATESPHLFFRAELSFCFALSSLLIHRCVDGPGSRRKGLEAAQTALRIIANVRGGGTQQQPRSPGVVAFLGRIFHQYPTLPFLEVYHHVVERPTPERLRAQAPLLAACVAAAADLVNPNFPRVFCALLHARMAWCLDVVDVFASFCSSPSPSPPPPPPPLAASRKGSLAGGPLLSRNSSVTGGLGVAAALDGFPGGGALFGGGGYAMDGGARAADGDLFGGAHLSPGGGLGMGDGGDAALQAAPLGSVFLKGQADVVVDGGEDLFRFSMDVDDPFWDMGV